MNKCIVKIELIAEWILLIIWLTLGLVICILYSIFLLHECGKEFVFICNVTNIITYILYIFIAAVIIKNLKKTNNILKNNTKKQEYELNHIITFILLIYIILTILWLTIGLVFATFLLVFCAPTLDGWLNSTSNTDFLKLYIIVAGIYFGSTFAFINSIPALSSLANNVNPSLFNKICLIGSGMLLLTILILTFNNLI